MNGSDDYSRVCGQSTPLGIYPRHINLFSGLLFGAKALFTFQSEHKYVYLKDTIE